MDWYNESFRSQTFLIFGLMTLLVSIGISMDAVLEIDAAFVRGRDAVHAQDAYDHLEIQVKDWALKNTTQPQPPYFVSIEESNPEITESLDRLIRQTQLINTLGQFDGMTDKLRSSYAHLQNVDGSPNLTNLAKFDSVLESMSAKKHEQLNALGYAVAAVINRLIYWSISSVIIAIILILAAINLKRREDLTKVGTIRALQNLKDEADSASLMKSKFLSTVSHELRTPLNAIIGLSDILASMEMKPSEKTLVRTIQQSGKTLLRIINDILDFSKIESGKIQLIQNRFSLVEVFNQILLSLSPQASKKSINLNYYIDPEVPSEVVSDPERLAQVLYNLIGNAIKFTHVGSVILRTNVVAKSPHLCVLEFSVQDTGIGMTPHEVTNLFHPFTQLKHSGTSGELGSGLGLSISQSIIEAMGSHIEVVSQPHHGTRFFFRMKFTEFSNSTLTSKPTFRALGIENRIGDVLPLALDRKIRVLVAEDNTTNQIVAQAMLDKMGVEAVIVSNGQEALETLSEFRNFDLILMDCQMPVLDGFETTRILRQQGNYTPIIALTANAFEEHQKKCFEVGMDAFVSKPIEFFQLRDALLSLIKPQTTLDIQVLEKLRASIGAENQKKVINAFLGTTTNLKKQFEQAAKDLDLSKMNALGHKLKGSAKTIGAIELAQVCEKLEKTTNQSALMALSGRVQSHLLAVESNLNEYLLQPMQLVQPSQPIDQL